MVDREAHEVATVGVRHPDGASMQQLWSLTQPCHEPLRRCGSGPNEGAGHRVDAASHRYAVPVVRYLPPRVMTGTHDNTW